MSETYNDPSKLPLRGLLGQLRLGTIWAICLALGGLIVGSFALGHWLGTTISQLSHGRPPIGRDSNGPWDLYNDLFTPKAAERSGFRTYQRWGGTWKTTQWGKEGLIYGQLWLEIDADGTAKGVFVDKAPDTIKGALHGTLGSHGEKMQGTWRNEFGRSGEFVFKLSTSKNAFSGYYSMDEQELLANLSNTWNGTRIEQ